MATTSNTIRAKRGRRTRRLGLLAIGSCGSWEIAIDETTSGPEQWFAQIDGPLVSVRLELSSLDVLDKALHLLDANKIGEKTSANGARHKRGVVILGKNLKTPVSLVRDDEFADRYFLVVGASENAIVRLTLSGADAAQVVGALRQIRGELDEA
jgi:hypothetical protein